MMIALEGARETADVTGYVEALTASAVLGWAWIPGQPGRLSMELRLGEDVLSRSLADELREDLAKNGIGDGRHAFNLPVPEAARPRLADLQVVARMPDGTSVPLGKPPSNDGVAEHLSQIARGLNAVMGSQRVLHRNVQAALLAPANVAAAGPATAELATAQATLGEAIATLELFVVRIEGALAGVVAPGEATGRIHWVLGAIAAMAATALAVSATALFRTLPG